MTWSYSGNPASSTTDAVRFLVGDTDTTDQLVSNEEIAYLYAEYGNVNRTAAQVCYGIAAKFARYMQRSIGGLSADFAAKYRQYLELGDTLLRREGQEPVAPFASGWSISAKESVEDDSDRETTFSRKGIHDNERVYPSDDYGATSYRYR